ncbi:MAG: glycosyltransferase [candidate division Zixibacteria bacterium]|nr:glycosyltransferase [candidate division Zixibacteria bacterium]
MSDVFISIIIPAFKSEATIGDLMQSTAALNAEIPHEVIVVDSSPDEITAGIVRQYEHVNLIRTEGRLTPGQARNLGAEKSYGQYFAFIDSDTEIKADYLDHLKETIEMGYDFIAGAIGNSPKNDTALSVAEYYYEFNEHSPYQPEKEIWFAGSCNLICRRDLFFKAGGFLPHRGSEDVMLSMKIKEMQKKIYFNPRVVVYHRNRKSLKKIRINTVMLGKFIAMFRKQGLMPSYGIVDKPLICWLIIPLFALIKIYRTLKRVLTSKDPRKFELVKYFPAYLLIIAFWATGFYIGAYGKNLDITR